PECFPTAPSRTAARSCSRALARNPPTALSGQAGCTTRRNPALGWEVFRRPCGEQSAPSKMERTIETSERDMVCQTNASRNSPLFYPLQSSHVETSSCAAALNSLACHL